jgi:hypothetical protein
MHGCERWRISGEMKPQASSPKKRTLSEPAFGVVVAVGAMLVWLQLHTFGPKLSEIVPLRITVVSAGSPVPGAMISVYFIGNDEKQSVGKCDENGECSLKWFGDSGQLVHIETTKNSDVLFADLVRVPWHRKLRLKVDKVPSPKTKTN